MKKRHSPGCPALTVVSPGDRNWERGYEWSKSFGALQRHAWAFWSGEDIDAETGSHHLAAVCFHAMAMMEWGRTRPDLDDRPASSHWLSQLPVPDGTVRVGVVDGDVS